MFWNSDKNLKRNDEGTPEGLENAKNEGANAPENDERVDAAEFGSDENLSLAAKSQTSVRQEETTNDVSDLTAFDARETPVETPVETPRVTPVETPVESETATAFEPSPDAERVAPTFDFEAIERLEAKIDKLANDFCGKLKYDAKKQEQIDSLYRENQTFKDGLVEQCKRSLINAVIEQIDDAEKQIAHFRTVEPSEANYRKLFLLFEDVALSFRDMLLERFDVESWQSDAGSAFDPKRQRSLRTTPTGDRALAKTLRRSIRFGYRTENGFVVRPELVDVYVFDASLAAAVESTESDGKPVADVGGTNAAIDENDKNRSL